MATSVIVGAGYSKVAGLPLTCDLFNSNTLILSKSAENRYNKVLRAWNDWHKNNLEKNAEEFIEYIFKSSYDSNAPLQRKWVVEIVAATLAFPLLSDSGSSNLRYMARVSRPVKLATAHPAASSGACPRRRIICT